MVTFIEFLDTRKKTFINLEIFEFTPLLSKKMENFWVDEKAGFLSNFFFSDRYGSAQVAGMFILLKVVG